MQSNRTDHAEPRPSFFQKGGVWVLAQFAVMAAWMVVTPLGHSIARSPWLWCPAVLLLAIGAMAGIAGTRTLGRNLTPFPKPLSDSQLTQTGIYALVRHPMYASLIALSLGWACLWGNANGVVLAVMQALLLDAKARREERWLKEAFPEYADYATKVRRLIPGIY